MADKLDRIIRNREWRVIDISDKPLEGDIVFPFAVEELACMEVAGGAAPLLHMWRHRKALVLGLRDRKLPRAAEAMAKFRAEGYSVMVRNSGGALVPLDEGVLNVTMIVPTLPGAIGVREDFAAMAAWVRQAIAELADLPVAVGEVAGAYCPGDFDLSIGGRKFCGIAQRRKLGAYAVQAFIVTEGSGAARAEQAARFYEWAGAGSPDALRVLPESTRSLQEWADAVTVAGLAGAFTTLLRRRAKLADTRRGHDLACLEQAGLADMIRRMKARYDTD